jgi:hypothetical protein
MSKIIDGQQDMETISQDVIFLLPSFRKARKNVGSSVSGIFVGIERRRRNMSSLQ